MPYSRKLELKTIKKMITIYCQEMHGTGKGELCPECKKLLDYAEQRINKCIYGDKKPVCSKCKVHCYQPARREDIKKVMRYSGPRMLYLNPLLTMRYMFRKVFKSNLKNDYSAKNSTTN